MNKTTSTVRREPMSMDDIYTTIRPREPDVNTVASVCNELGIETLWNVGGGKIQSSSDLVASVKGKNKK